MMVAREDGGGGLGGHLSSGNSRLSFNESCPYVKAWPYPDFVGPVPGDAFMEADGDHQPQWLPLPDPRLRRRTCRDACPLPCASLPPCE